MAPSNYGTPLFLGPWNILCHKIHLMAVAICSLKTPYYDLLQTKYEFPWHKLWIDTRFILRFWLIGLKSQWAYLIINHKLCTICLWTHSDGAHGGEIYPIPTYPHPPLPLPTPPHPYLPPPTPTPTHPYPYLPPPTPTPTYHHPRPTHTHPFYK